MRSFLIFLALVVFVLGELAAVVQKNRNRRAGQADGAEPARTAERKPRRRAAMSMLAVGTTLLVISVIVIISALSLSLQRPTVVVEKDDSGTVTSYQIAPSRDPRRILALPAALMIGGAAIGLFVRRYRAEVREWEEPSEGESAPAAPTPDKGGLPPDAAQKKREALARLLEAGLLTREEYRERLKKLE